MSVDALVFDAYGTLYDVHSVVRRCETCFPGKGTQLSQLWRAKQLEYTWQRSLMQRYVPFSEITREALAYSCAALGLDATTHVEELMDEYLRLAPFPEVPAALERLPMKRAILSNGSPDLLEPLVRNSGLRFDAVLSVDELRIYKPAPHVYELAERRLNVAKERIGFVSSNCWDALGAKSYGFRVYWINRGGAPLDRLGFRPNAELRSLATLPDEIRPDEVLR
jgi:2-haloacid dehalogenase